jgi:uncharacterized coiled-coil protein SlyX
MKSLEQRVEELEVLTGFQERLIADLQREVVAFTQRVEKLEVELRRVRESRAQGEDQTPLDGEDDRVPSCG